MYCCSFGVKTPKVGINLALLSLTVPAIRFPDKKDEKFINQSDYELTKNKVESIFKVAINNNFDSLVLGAMGCGVFQNPLVDIVEIFKQSIQKYFWSQRL